MEDSSVVDERVKADDEIEAARRRDSNSLWKA